MPEFCERDSFGWVDRSRGSSPVTVLEPVKNEIRFLTLEEIKTEGIFDDVKNNEAPTVPEIKYIYKMSWFDSKRHLKSNTVMYYLDAEDTLWVFEDCCEHCDPYRVELVKVWSNSKEYEMAFGNSQLRKANK